MSWLIDTKLLNSKSIISENQLISFIVNEMNRKSQICSCVRFCQSTDGLYYYFIHERCSERAKRSPQHHALVTLQATAALLVRPMEIVNSPEFRAEEQRLIEKYEYVWSDVTTASS